jgi:hypothetical protein
MVRSESLDALPPFWQEIWREAEARIPDDTIKQSCFNDGAHFVIGKLVEAVKDLVRLRKIDDAHDGPWEDQDAFNVFNRQISEAYHATERRWSEVVGAEVVEAMWQCPADDETSATIAADDAVLARMRTEMIAWRDHWIEASRRAGGCGSWDEAAAKLDRWITALATPSPTIAAPSPSNEADTILTLCTERESEQRLNVAMFERNDERERTITDQRGAALLADTVVVQTAKHCLSLNATIASLRLEIETLRGQKRAMTDEILEAALEAYETKPAGERYGWATHRLGMHRAIIAALEADAQKEAALKALCAIAESHEVGPIVDFAERIRAIYGWREDR